MSIIVQPKDYSANTHKHTEAKDESSTCDAAPAKRRRAFTFENEGVSLDKGDGGENPGQESSPESVSIKVRFEIDQAVYAKHLGIENKVIDDYADSLTQDELDLGDVATEDATVNISPRISQGNCATPASKCSAANPLTCRFHGAQMIAVDIENFVAAELQQAGVQLSNASVTVDLLSAKNGKLTAEASITVPKGMEKYVQNALKKFFAVPGVSGDTDDMYDSNGAQLNPFEIDMLNANAVGRWHKQPASGVSAPTAPAPAQATPAPAPTTPAPAVNPSPSSGTSPQPKQSQTPTNAAPSTASSGTVSVAKAIENAFAALNLKATQGSRPGDHWYYDNGSDATSIAQAVAKNIPSGYSVGTYDPGTGKDSSVLIVKTSDMPLFTNPKFSVSPVNWLNGGPSNATPRKPAVQKTLSAYSSPDNDQKDLDKIKAAGGDSKACDAIQEAIDAKKKAFASALVVDASLKKCNKKVAAGLTKVREDLLKKIDAASKKITKGIKDEQEKLAKRASKDICLGDSASVIKTKLQNQGTFVPIALDQVDSIVKKKESDLQNRLSSVMPEISDAKTWEKLKAAVSETLGTYLSKAAIRSYCDMSAIKHICGENSYFNNYGAALMADNYGVGSGDLKEFRLCASATDPSVGAFVRNLQSNWGGDVSMKFKKENTAITYTSFNTGGSTYPYVNGSMMQNPSIASIGLEALQYKEVRSWLGDLLKNGPDKTFDRRKELSLFKRDHNECHVFTGSTHARVKNREPILAHIEALEFVNHSDALATASQYKQVLKQFGVKIYYGGGKTMQELAY